MLRRLWWLWLGLWLVGGCGRTPALPSPTPWQPPTLPGPTSTPFASLAPTPTESPTAAASPVPTSTPVPTPEPSPTPTPTPVCGSRTGMTILVAGTYRSIYSLADAIRLVHLDFVRGRVAVVPLPRDLRVDLPPGSSPFPSPVKLNSSYVLGTPAMRAGAPREGGAQLLAATITYNFGIPIDRYLIVSADGFVAFIDALGGIPVYLPRPIQDPNTQADFPAGHQWLDGEQALKLARVRSDSNDFVRIQRQTQILQGVLRRLTQLDAWTRLPAMLTALRRGVITNLEPGDVRDALCLWRYMQQQGREPEFYAVPRELLQGTRDRVYLIRREARAYVLLWDEAYVQWLHQALFGEAP